MLGQEDWREGREKEWKEANVSRGRKKEKREREREKGCDQKRGRTNQLIQKKNE